MITQASSHARSDSQRLVDSGEVVVYGVDRNHCLVILNFLQTEALPAFGWRSASSAAIRAVDIHRHL